MRNPGRLAVPLLILVSAGCPQAVLASQHQLQTRVASISGRCGTETARLKAMSPTKVTMELPGGVPAEASQQASLCTAEVKKIPGAGLSPKGAGAGATDQGLREK